MCFILFFFRSFPIPKFHKVLYGLTFLVLGWMISVSIVAGFQCRPHQYFWLQLFDPTAKGKCINLGHFYIANGALSAAIDFLILLSPIPIITRLHMPLSQKVPVIGIFLLGGLYVLSGSLLVSIMFLSYD